MISTPACPEEPWLLALAAGDYASEWLCTHLAGCAGCRERLRRIQVEVSLLRRGGIESCSPGDDEPPA